MAAGRKSKYNPEFAERAAKLCEAGALDKDLAQVFGVHISTIYDWKHAHAEFADALKRSKEVADDAVELALFRKATGYTFDSEKVFQYEGQVVRAKITEHVPPDTTAIIFWLKNRRGDKWRDKVEQEVNLKGDLAEMIAARRARMNDGQ